MRTGPEIANFCIPAKEKTAEIYALCDPDTLEVRYVGKANNAKTRLTGHLWYSTRRNTPLYSWIRKLESLGKVPLLRILEVVPHSRWQEAEKRLIAKFRASARLLNLADGGDEPYCSPKTRSAIGKRNAAKYFTRESRAANGRVNAKALHSDPLRKRRWYLVQSMSADLGKFGKSNAFMTERHYKRLLLNCMALSDICPDAVPRKWRQLRWDVSELGDLNEAVMREHMAPKLLARFDLTKACA